MTKTGCHPNRKRNELPVISEETPLTSIEQNLARSTIKDGDDGVDDNNGGRIDQGSQLGSSPLWSGSKEGWELTWPIWHFLPRDERKRIAEQHGYNSIGTFEEFMSLQQAVGDSGMPVAAAAKVGPILSSSSFSSSIQKAYPNELIYPKGLPDSDDQKSPSSKGNYQHDDDDDADGFGDEYNLSDVDEQEVSTSDLQPSEKLNDVSLNELMLKGSIILMLPEEVMHQIFSCLPVDAYGTMALVSPHWKHLTRTEAVYRRLCERVFLNQSRRRQLHVSRFDGSYRRMLEVRPRVRAAGGCYVLKYSQVKKIQRDMWTEIPVGAILETVYYRYLYFQENGRVLYALSSAPPHEMFRRLLKVVLHRVDDPAAVWGTFQVHKHNCSIVARQEWHTVKFDLAIVPTSNFGRFAALTMERHLSSPSGCFEDWSQDKVEYAVPTETFRFIKDSRL
jgi:F-box protein 9